MIRHATARWHPWVRRDGHLALVVAILLVWSVVGSSIASMLLLPAWVITTQLIFAGSLETARLRRRAWLGQYLQAASPWHRWLRGGLVMIAWHQLLGILLALLLLVKLRLLSPVYWPVLWIGVAGLIWLRSVMRRRLARHVIAEYLPAVTRRLQAWPLGLLLTVLLVLLALWLPQHYLVGLGWEEALMRHVPADGHDSLLGFFERLARALEVTQYWAMQNATERGELSESLALVGWLLLLLVQSAFAWAYVRLLMGAETLREATLEALPMKRGKERE
ncbi:hypothetical protein [Halomonas chromatireducens]|uniref:Uncharacterized protein n=1 Tax=Halomonas chromatireducens TaxID=507626 RepID=A0A0X8HBD2_9GAMM|nr:hypothetical protein [Halomonas chromatireducens]AMC99507.1 hypothetical protein LOKO_00412 [Halomonas chromatireducens]